MTTPLFSIITVTKNAELYLKDTLSSVSQQSFQDFEYIIFDGCSNDNTDKIVHSFKTLHFKNKLHFTSEKDKGLYDAMNKGIDRARGTYLIFLNAGDTFHSVNTLEIIAQDIIENNYPDIIYGQTIIVNRNREKIGERHLIAPKDLTVQSFSNGMVVCHQGFWAKRSIVGYYDLQYKFSADYKWCIECLQKSRSNHLSDSVLVDYLYGGLTDRNRVKSLNERFKIMCNFYGISTTIVKHISFIPRYLKRRLEERKFFEKR